MVQPFPTYEQMLADLSWARIDHETFNKGPKGLDGLYDELKNGEAWLVRNLETGRLERHARSAKAKIECHGMELCEMRRAYLNALGKVIKVVKYPSPQPGVSETPQAGESFADAIGRGFLQEWGVIRSQYEFVPFLIGGPETYWRDHGAHLGILCYDHLRYGTYGTPDFVHPLDYAGLHPDVHESKAFLGILSVVMTVHFRLIMPVFDFPNGRKLTDNKTVVLFLKWNPLFPGLISTADLRT